MHLIGAVYSREVTRDLINDLDLSVVIPEEKLWAPISRFILLDFTRGAVGVKKVLDGR